MNYLSASGAAFLVSVTCLLALRPLARMLGLMDKPGGRKMHAGEIPVIGGISIFLGMLVAATGDEMLGHRSGLLVADGAFMVLIGALDDRFDLSARVRLLAQVSAAVVLIYGSGLVVPHLGDLLGLGEIRLGFLAIPFTVVAIVALINAFNMLDGLDGLAASVGFCAFMACLLLSSSLGLHGLKVISGSMVGAILGFALFNLPLHFNRPVRTFMGDAGSTLLGFVLAGTGLLMVQGESGVSVPPVALLWMLPIPIFELFSSFARRLYKGLHPMQADAGHFHHVFYRAGWSVRAIALLYFIVSAMSAWFAYWAVIHEVQEAALFLGFLLIFAAWIALTQCAHLLVRALPAWARVKDLSTGH